MSSSSSTTTTSAPAITRLADWRPPAFLVETVELLFDLHDEHADVTSTVAYRRNPAARPDDDDLLLDGVNLHLLSLTLDGEDLPDGAFEREPERLRLRAPPERFTLQVTTRLRPQDNTTLEGLYRSGGLCCTQMEAQGFRRVTFFPDRPDVLGVWTTTIVADAARFPVLLSNGNLVDHGAAPAGRHFATWHDPHRKPCYLFALVAGDLARIDDTFTTRSGRAVSLRLFVNKGDEGRTAHAMESLKRAMAWDEQRFGREYDLDVFMTVAISEFNLGAMENKGLNLFNAQVILAAPETATDDDFARIEAVVGHEYFHNWSGNRVTCRDWFQLSLKEGFTVYRDQEFSADVGHRAVARIDDVLALRELQFPEDGGPLAHPVRPASFITIDNFYTTTIYEKGAEVIRMLATVLGTAGFRRGADLYFERHDGQAVTVEDFRAALGDATGHDLSPFRRWYEQAGTPRLQARMRHDAQSRTWELSLEQSCPPTPGQPRKEPFPIPVRLAALSRDGRELPLRLAGEPADAAATTRVLLLTEAKATYRFVDVPAPPVPSLLRGFSAPVRLDDGLSDDDLAFLAVHDGDLFNRWEAGQRLLSSVLLRLVAELDAGRPASLPRLLADTVGRLLDDTAPAAAWRARALTLPEPSVLAGLLDTCDPERVHEAHEFVRGGLARAHGERLSELYERLHERTTAAVQRARAQAVVWDPAAAGERALKNACLSLLAALPERGSLRAALRQLEQAACMTDEQAALALLAERDNPFREEALDRFAMRWRGDALVMDKWYAAQAASARAQTVDEVQRLSADPAFDFGNPNRVRALFRTFARNFARFHGRDGRGYALLGDVVLRLDRKNPILAARLATHLEGWRRVAGPRPALMRAQLERFLQQPGPSKNLYEVASKALG